MILPSTADRRHTAVPWTVWSLVIACAFTWVATAAGDYRLALDWGYRPVSPSISTALASAFLHGGFFHLFGNMLFLWTFGNAVEDSIGRLNFLLVFLLTHAFAILAHSMAHPGDFGVAVGASGAVSGVMGVYAFLFSKRRVTLHFFVGPFRVGKAAVSAVAAVLGWFAMDLAFALLDSGSQVGGTAYWAHVGGAVMGFIMGMLFDGLGMARKLPPG